MLRSLKEHKRTMSSERKRTRCPTLVLSLGIVLLSILSMSLILNIVFIPDGWIDAGPLGCFKLLHAAVNLSWVEAQIKCEAEGGYLAEPKTAR